MFRKIRTRNETGPTAAAFPESFWHWYADSYSRLSTPQTEALPHNPKSYTSKSSAVVQIKSFFESPPSTHQVVALLKSPFTNGDIVRTYTLLRFFQLSENGFFITNDGFERSGAHIDFAGAENWENVMCYLDALLFSMFANLESFEPILFLSNQHADPKVDQLSGLLRVYVNLLRSGNLITTDITMRLCECLMKLGYNEAMSHRQQDVAPLFEFLTETLQMPLLTFKVEIKHSGKHENDDTKYSKERILFVSVPDAADSATPVKPEDKFVENPSDGSDAILLEECLEHYFNNSISVKRELERRATLDSLHGPSEAPEKKEVSEADVELSQDLPTSISFSTRARHSTQGSQSASLKARTRSSTLSIWSMTSLESKPKEVMLPAWMLLRLLPFYTDDNTINTANESVARNSREFVNRRPVLPICLKRYSFDAEEQSANRSNKRIIIPPVIELPSFVADDVDTETGGFKLILESALCHRGTTIASGHFVSAVRKNIHTTEETLEESLNAEWYLYDDLKKKKVVKKTFGEIFDAEWPYMLFYRLASSSSKSSSVSSISSVKDTVSSVVAPKGSRSKYWNEDTLTPILSRSDSKSDVDSKNGSTSAVLNSLESTVKASFGSDTSTSSIPIPDILPSSPKYTDIRQRYLWYLTDEEMNYYKEIPQVSKTGSRNMSISFTPQFRRNSQWSENSNISGLALAESAATEKIDMDKVYKKLENLKPSDTQGEEAEEKKHRHLSPFRHGDKKSGASLQRKEHKRRLNEYKKEKCVIA